MGRLEPALERMERAFAVLSEDEPDADFATLAQQLGRLQVLSGNLDRSASLVELALSLAEAMRLPDILSQAMNTFGVIASWRGRPETAEALFMHSLKLALEHDLPSAALRAYNNVADSLHAGDRYEEAVAYHDRGIALARRVGNRQWEWQLLLESIYPLMLAGRWNEALARAIEIPPHQFDELANPVPSWCEIEAARGNLAEARRALGLVARHEASADVQARAVYRANEAAVLCAEGRYERALAAGEEALESRWTLGPRHQCVKGGFVYGVEAGLALGRLDAAEELVERVEALRPGELAPFVQAHSSRFRGRLAAARGEDDRVEGGFKAAESIFREFGIPFWLAVTETEHGEWLRDHSRAQEAEPLLAEARETFERLEAAPWVERVAALGADAEVEVAG
jgi:tetratricopeptide (TPR) repeat protein